MGAVAAVLLMSAVASAIFPTQGVGRGSSDIWVMNVDDTNQASVVASYINRSGGQDTSFGGTVAPLATTAS